MSSTLKKATTLSPIGKSSKRAVHSVVPTQNQTRSFGLIEVLSRPAVVAIVVAFVLYSGFWGFIGIAKFYALNSSVYDLGISMQTAYMLIGTNLNLANYLTFFFTRNGIAFIVSPIAIAKSYPALILLQAASVGAAVFPLYGICRHQSFTESSSVLISLSYLMYFPLDGLVWFDFHYQMFFVTFFILAYYLFLKRWFGMSLMFFLLAGIVRYPFVLFPFIFSCTLLVELTLRRFVKHQRVERESLVFLTVLLLLTSILLVLGYVAIGGIGSIVLHTTGNNSIAYEFNVKLLTFFLLLGPLLFIPLLSFRWIWFYIPFLYLALTANSGNYLFPELFHRQFSSGIVPFLYLGLIDGIANISRLRTSIGQALAKSVLHSPSRLTPANRARYHQESHARLKKMIPMCIVVILVSCSFFFQPYGPLNSTTPDNYNLSSEIKVNMTLFHNLEYLLALIPKNEGHVLIQNNIVIALPGPIGQNVLVPQYDVGPNITISNVIRNEFPTLEGQVTGFTPINYAIADANDQRTLLQYGIDGFPNMLGIFQLLLGSGYYGIVAERSNMILIERNYIGTVDYSPFYGTYGAAVFHTRSGFTSNGYISITNASKGANLWFGPFSSPWAAYLSLVPGEYSASFVVAATNHSNTNSMQFVVATDGGVTILSSLIVRGANLSINERWSIISIRFNLSNIVSGLEFEGISLGWNGTVTLKEVILSQTSAL